MKKNFPAELLDLIMSLFTALCFSNGAVMPSLGVRPSVCPSVRLSVTLVSTDHIH